MLACSPNCPTPTTTSATCSDSQLVNTNCPEGTRPRLVHDRAAECKPGMDCQGSESCTYICSCLDGDTKCEGDSIVKVCKAGSYVRQEDCADKGGRCTGAVGTAGCDTCPDPNQKRCGGAGVCRSIWSPQDCGDCDKPCLATLPGETAECVQGRGCERKCPSGMRVCADSCVDTSSDPANCGGCGIACTNSNGSTACASGVCAPKCDTVHADCDGRPNNGCEADLTAATSCGTCSTQCLLPSVCGATGSGYGCRTCESRGLSTCDAGGGNKVCSDLANDPNNCGSCGLVCPGGTCKGGHCDSCSVTVPAGQTWTCMRNAPCKELTCPNMIQTPANRIFGTFSGPVIGDAQAKVNVFTMTAGGIGAYEAYGPDIEQNYGVPFLSGCGSSSTSSTISCPVPKNSVEPPLRLQDPQPDGSGKIIVRVTGFCGSDPQFCRIQPGAKLSIHHLN